MEEKDFNKRFEESKPREIKLGRLIIAVPALILIFLSNYIQTPNGFASIAAAGICGAIGAVIGYGVARLFKIKM